MAEAEQRSVAPGLFGEDADGPYLLASKCSRCDEVVFPEMLDCPKCQSFETMHPLRLSGRATVREFVVTHRGPAGFAVPYIQAYVQLEEGPVIYSMIDATASEDAVAVGDAVTMRIATIREVDGVQVIGWKFAPPDDDRTPP
jgi:uncharacterized OB-fold protein